MTLNVVGTTDYANSYVTLTFANQFFTDRGMTDFLALTNTIKEYNLIQACDWLERNFRYRGSKATQSQRLSFPRIFAYDNDGYLLPDIPWQIMEAQCLAADCVRQGLDLMGVLSSAPLIKSQQVDVLQVEYFTPSEQGVNGASILSHVHRLLRDVTMDGRLLRT